MIGGADRCVLTYGSFDGLPYNDVRLLRRLSGMGDRLIVGLSTDEFSTAHGESPIKSFRQRRATLEACRFVDRVIPQTDWSQRRTDIVNHNVAIFAMGDAWAGHFDDLNDLTQVVYVPQVSSLVAPKPPNFNEQQRVVIA